MSNRNIDVGIPEGFKKTELGPLPEEWKVVRVKEISKKLKAGGTPSRREPKYWNGNVPFVLIEDMTACSLYLSKTKETITEEGLNSSSTWLVQPNTLLLSMYATIGETAINTIPLATNQAILAIVPEEYFDVIFGAYLLKFNAKRLKMQNIQSTQKNVNKGVVENFKIPLPPLLEQKKIAVVLSAVQEAKEKTEAVIKTTRALKKSLMKHLFTYGPVPLEEAESVPLKETEIGPVPEGWEVVRLGKVVKKAEQKDPKRIPDCKFKYIDVSSIDRETLKIVGYKSYQGKDAPSRAKKLVKNEDVVFATVRPTLQRLAIIDGGFDGEICSTAFCVLRAKEDILSPLYMFYAVQRDIFIDELGKIQRGASYPAVTDSDVKNRHIPLPPLPTQQKIAEILSAVDKKIEAEENKKKALEELFKTLLSNLMTGKIRVHNLEVAA